MLVSMSNRFFSGDVVVSGGGLAGLTLALALHRAGLSVAIIDAMALDARTAPAFDGRASALAYTSWRMLEAVGAAAHLEPHAQRIEDIGGGFPAHGRAQARWAGTRPAAF